MIVLYVDIVLLVLLSVLTVCACVYCWQLTSILLARARVARSVSLPQSASRAEPLYEPCGDAHQPQRSLVVHWDDRVDRPRCWTYNEYQI